MFSPKFINSLQAIIYISKHCSNEPISAKKICDENNISRRYLEVILQDFVKCGLLKSYKGSKGGYSIAKERRKINLGDIFEIVAFKEFDENFNKIDRDDDFKQLLITQKENILKTLSKTSLEDIHNLGAEKVKLAGSFDI